MRSMLEYRVGARRVDSRGSVASAKEAEIILDTDVGCLQLFYPVACVTADALRRYLRKPCKHRL